jgi:uncharacterized membrane protein
MLKNIWQIFIKGILTILPIVITLALIMWLVSLFEFFFGGLLHLIFPKSWYHFGMGLMLGLTIIFCIGLAVQLWLGKKIFYFFEKVVLHIPVIKEIYYPIKQVQNMLVKSDKPKPGRAVMVKVKDGIDMVGVVMNETPGEQLKRTDGKIAVLLLFSYQMGGFTVYVDPENVEPLDMSVEQALKFTLTAGISIKKVMT